MEKIKSIKKIDYEIRIHKKLVLAFGKNGIQSVIIENVIPEIENVANRLLNKITILIKRHKTFKTIKVISKNLRKRTWLV